VSLDLLSNREEDVIELLCKGKTVKEISAELMVTVNTTKTHLRGIYKKLGYTQKRKQFDWYMIFAKRNENQGFCLTTAFD